ncbi:MAG: HD-GYP domain-containing protein, partial [Halanaerobiaceae bacterium]
MIAIKLKPESRIIIIYLTVSLIWIYLSDLVVDIFINNQIIINKIQTFKGLFFVFVTAIIFYKIIHNTMEDLRNNNMELRDNYLKIKFVNNMVNSLNRELEQSNSQINRLAGKLEAVIEVMVELASANITNEEEFLSKLLHTATKIIPECNYGSVYIFKNGKVQFIDAIGHDINLLQEINIEEKIFDKITEEVSVVKNVDIYISKKLPDEYSTRIYQKASKRIKQSLIFGLFIDDDKIGGISLDIAAGSDRSFNDKAIRTMKGFKNLASAFFALTRYNIVQQEFQEEIILSLLEILEIHDTYTGGHSHNVAKLAKEIAKEVGLSEEKTNKIYWAGLVHDIGKTLIPEQILNKPSTLNDEEYSTIKKHPLWGYKILKNSQKLRDIAWYILYHHERWDGTGYPEGIAEDEIPLISQILSVADAWDAMRSERAYRNKLPYSKAIKEIKENSGTQFSPGVTEA